GKTTNNDSNKNSFVKLLGLDESINQANILSNKCLEDLEQFDEKLKNNLYHLLKEYFFRHKI
ncbi:MAG: polyprenyl synthetase family protein, partial [Campylobacterales bacterium]|nr:polyprenyl synthetase family protein [Campylobacterales bacterium]NWF67403.1 polyprenyl synthetase family protein [Campylobacterales bacterium]